MKLHQLASFVGATSHAVTLTFPATAHWVQGAQDAASKKSAAGTVHGGYTLVKELQTGSDGKVYKAAKGSDVKAVKIATRHRLSDPDSIPGEVRIQLKIPDHPHILRMDNWSIISRKEYMVVSELCHGDLHDYMHDKRKKCKGWNVTNRQAAQILGQLLSAVICLRKSGITHNDIKSENVLLVKTPSTSASDGKSAVGKSAADAADASGDSPEDEFIVKLCDFSRSQRRLKWQSRYLCGTVDCMAPETTLHNVCGTPGEVWSLGVLLCEIVMGECPTVKAVMNKSRKDPDSWLAWVKKFRDLEAHEVEADLMKHSRRFAALPAELRQLLSTMLHPSAAARATPENCLNSEWMRSHLGEDRIVQLLGGLHHGEDPCEEQGDDNRSLTWQTPIRPVGKRQATGEQNHNTTVAAPEDGSGIQDSPRPAAAGPSRQSNPAGRQSFGNSSSAYRRHGRSDASRIPADQSTDKISVDSSRRRGSDSWLTHFLKKMVTCSGK